MKELRTIQFEAREHNSAHDALVELNFSGDHAIMLWGRYFTISDAEFRRLENEGLSLTTLHHHEPTGRIISVPGND